MTQHSFFIAVSGNRFNFCLFFIILCAVIVFCGCSTPEERQAKEAKVFSKKLHKAQKKERQIISKIADKFNASIFPPSTINKAPYTYDLQKILKEHAGKSFIFKAYIRDIEQTDRGLVAEFLCPVSGNLSNYDGLIIIMKLEINKEAANKYILEKRKAVFLRSLRCLSFDQPDYLVVAKVREIVSLRMFKHNCSGAEGGIQEYYDIVNNFLLASGQFIEAVPFPKIPIE